MPLTVDPAALTAAQAALAALGSALATTTAGVAAPTTVIAPAGADSISIQQAAIFSAYGTALQAILTEGETYQTQFETNLGAASDTYSFTEAANASQAAAQPGGILDGISYLLGGPNPSTGFGGPVGASSNMGSLLNIGGGNWTSAGSDLLGLAGGGLIDPIDAADVAGAADLAGTTAPVGGMGGMGGMGAMPVAAVGNATMVGNKLAVPPSWAGAAPATSSATAVQTVGWTGAAPQAGAGGIIPGMPGMGAAARNSAGFGAPRYGVKPIVMPKVKAI